MIESEKKIEKSLDREIKKIGGLTLKLVTLHYIGLPDRICLLPGGRVFFAELKTTKAKPRKIQVIVHNRLRLLGFKVYVIDSTNKVKNIVNGYKNTK